ncbi:MAG: outer membrane beta-barrel family protein [Niabella sp.]
MRKFVYFLSILLLVLPACAVAQTVNVKGKLIDSADNKSMQNAVITLLRAKDSTLMYFTRAKQDGAFAIANVDTGAFILMATHPNYADFVDRIVLDKESAGDFGVIPMLSKAKLMEEVIVKGNRSMYLKGDTTVFTADSFKVAEGANVEELLRKLPGFQVGRDGKITAMGETVKKVLVDGEEFFGSDPGIATKNLRADVVDEVQVYDRTSDQATFTGIDDGVRDKTVNLKLKEDKKKGYFGKIDAGGGYKDRYYGAGMLNAFKAKRKFAAYGITSNTGWMNLDWDDNQKYGGGGNMEVMDGGGIIMWGDNDYNSSNGIPVNYNAGVHYSDKFNQDKNSLNASYKFVKISSPGTTRVYSKNFTPDSSWSSNSVTDFENISDKHNGNFTFESKLDSMNTLKLTTSANFNYGKNKSVYQTENINDKTGYYINKNIRDNHEDTDRSAYNANLLWMHKFKKNFRTFSINTAYNYSKNKSDGYLYSKMDFYNKESVDSTSLLDQRNLVTNNNNSFNTRVSYTEPLAKDFYMEASYTFAYNKRNNIRDITQKGISGSYDNRIDSLSNDYEFNDMSNRPGLNFRYSNKKVNLSLGSSIAFTNYEQVNKTKSTNDSYNFANHYPTASFNYKIKPNENLRFYYNGNSSAPSLDQLQPIRVNTDPLNIYTGNPDLRPSFFHRFNLNYSSWKMLSERSIYVGGGYSFTHNAFVNSSYIKDAVRTSRTVNTNGVYNYYIYGYYNKKLKKINIDLGLNPEFNYSRGVDFIAGGNGESLRNENKNQYYSFEVSLSRYVEKKYNLRLSPRYGYNIVKATVSTAANAKYWSAGGWINGRLYLPKEFELSTDVNLEFREKDPRFPTDNNFTIWDAELVKWIFKKKVQLKFAVKDMLDQRNGYNRNFGSYSFTETYNTILRRHFLLGFVWNFNQMNGASNGAK